MGQTADDQQPRREKPDGFWDRELDPILVVVAGTVISFIGFCVKASAHRYENQFEAGGLLLDLGLWAQIIVIVWCSAIQIRFGWNVYPRYRLGLVAACFSLFFTVAARSVR